MKKIIVLLLAAFLLTLIVIPAAASDLTMLSDGADLLSKSEWGSLNEKLEKISDKLDFDFVVATVDSIGEEDVEVVSEAFYFDSGYGRGEERNGVILFIAMEERKWDIFVPHGFSEDALNSDARNHLADEFTGYLSDGEYYEAFMTFAEEAEAIVSDAENGEYYKEPFDFKGPAIIGAIISLITSGASTSSMKSKMKSVRAQTAAANYVVPGSLVVTDSSERFLYTTVTRTPKPTESSSRSSGGGSGGGSHTSGSF